MCDLYVATSYTRGNFKEGDLEFVFGMMRPVARHLTGDEYFGNDSVIGVAQHGSTVRLYGAESKEEFLARSLPGEFRTCAAHKVQAWVYRSSTVKGEDIPDGNAVGGFATRSSNLHTWDDRPRKVRWNIDVLKYGPGFVEFAIPELYIPSHGGRQSKYDPYQEVREYLTRLGASFSEDAETLVISKRRA